MEQPAPVAVETTSAVPYEESVLVDICDDMYCGSLPSDIISDFTCMLCYGIVQDPIKCTRCNNLVCEKCIDKGKMLKGRLSCYKTCGNKQFEKLQGCELAFYNGLVFRCVNDECKERVPLGRYRDHLKNKCKVMRYRALEEPEGALSQTIKAKELTDEEKEAEERAALNPYRYSVFVGDLQRMYLEEGEALDQATLDENERAHNEYNQKIQAEIPREVNPYGDYDDDYDEEYGME